jgi:hypothetical protein
MGTHRIKLAKMVVREHASLNIFKRVDKYYVTAFHEFPLLASAT